MVLCCYIMQVQAIDLILRDISEKVEDVRSSHNAIVAATEADESLLFVSIIDTLFLLVFV